MAKRLTRSATVLTGALLPMALVAACSSGSGSSSTSSSSAASGSKDIYLVSCSDQVPWCAKYNATAKAGFEAKSYKVTVLGNPFDPALQNQHMNQAITAKPAAIVVLASDVNAIVPAVNRATAAGIPVVNVDSPLPDGAKPSFSILNDHTASGTFAAEGIIAGLKTAGKTSANILIAAGALSMATTQTRLTSFGAGLAANPEYKVVSTIDTAWDQDKATQMSSQIFAQWQAKGGIQAVFAANDLIALGVEKAAQQAGIPVGAKKGGLVIVSGNCLSPGVQALKDDVLFTSATQTPGPIAEATVQQTVAALGGTRQPVVIFVPNHHITQ